MRSGDVSRSTASSGLSKTSCAGAEARDLSSRAIGRTESTRSRRSARRWPHPRAFAEVHIGHVLVVLQHVLQLLLELAHAAAQLDRAAPDVLQLVQRLVAVRLRAAGRFPASAGTTSRCRASAQRPGLDHSRHTLSSKAPPRHGCWPNGLDFAQVERSMSARLRAFGPPSRSHRKGAATAAASGIPQHRSGISINHITSMVSASTATTPYL